jgi:acetyltransferase-like isoleucine patch superfamily enzyme
MIFGINNIVKNGFFKTVYYDLKKMQYLIGSKGKNLRLGFGCSLIDVSIGNFVYIGDFAKISNTQIGDFSYISSKSRIRDTKIGKFCSIGSGVKIVLGKHPTNFVSTHPAFYSNNKPFLTFSNDMHYDEYSGVIIGNDVWIAEDAIITGGVKIGDGAIIAARAVVTKDVEPYSIVGGVPAKHIKFRFEKNIRENLIKNKWWNNDIPYLRKNHLLFLDIKSFFNTND